MCSVTVYSVYMWQLPSDVCSVLWGCSPCAVGLCGGLLSGVEFCIILLFDCVTSNARPLCVHLSPVQLFYLCVLETDSQGEKGLVIL